MTASEEKRRVNKQPAAGVRRWLALALPSPHFSRV